MAKRTKLPAVSFKFAEDTEYHRGRDHSCEVTFNQDQIQFRFERYGSTQTVCMANEDFDAFQTWYQIARKFNQEVAPVLDTSE